MKTKEYTDNRSPNHPPEVPSVYEDEDRVILHWEDDELGETVRSVTPKWARIMADHLLDSAEKIDPAQKDARFSFKETLKLNVDIDGTVRIGLDQRVPCFNLSPADIHALIEELREARRQSGRYMAEWDGERMPPHSSRKQSSEPKPVPAGT